MNPKITQNKFNSGFFTFVKDYGEISDKELLKRLNVLHYQILPAEKGKNFFEYDCPKLYLTEDNEWTHIIDDYAYSFMKHLWIHREQEIILNLAKDFEIFQCSINEMDEGFGFSYYNGGRLQRQYIVRNRKSSFTETYVDKNFGDPFFNEEIALKKNGQKNKVLSVAELLGIKINHNLKDIRSYEILDMKI